MSGRRLSIVFLGLSLSSSWGNGHATTYRALLKALRARGHDLLFLERDMPWYADNRDLRRPSFCRLGLYHDLPGLERRYGNALSNADVVVVGSYVPEGVEVARLALDRAEGRVGFYDIDTPVTISKLDRGDAEYLAPDLIPRFAFYLSFSAGPVLARLRTEYGARRATPFHCMVDPELYRPTGERPVWDVGYLGTYSADRQPALERLLIEPARRLPDRRFVVAGPQYPEDIDWPENVDRIEHVPPGDHASFYSRLRFALNLTRADMMAMGWSPSVRLFEAAACGTAILTDRWCGFDNFFPDGEAILSVASPSDVMTALSLNPVTVRKIGDCGRKIVLAEHTGTRRAETFEAVVGPIRESGRWEDKWAESKREIAVRS